MNKTQTIFLLLFATAIFVGCRQSLGQENEAAPTINPIQTHVAPVPATRPLAPIQQETVFGKSPFLFSPLILIFSSSVPETLV